MYKSKGDTSDVNNYRGISVLSPLAKIFEKFLVTRLRAYFNQNTLLCAVQHGLRSSHSCETALHELISDLNVNRNKKLIKILLFIDFKKAFDLVDSKMLLRKLFHCGFEKSALEFRLRVSSKVLKNNPFNVIRIRIPTG